MDGAGIFYHFCGPIFKYFAEQDGILHVVEIVQVRKVSYAHYFIELSHVFVLFIAYYFIPERAVELGFSKKITLGL